MSMFHQVTAVRPIPKGLRPATPVVPIERVRPIIPQPVEKTSNISKALARMVAVAEAMPEPVAPLVPAPARRVRTLPTPPPAAGGTSALKIAECLSIVAAETGIRVGAMKSPMRLAEIVKARQSAAFIAKRFTGRSLPEIGRRLGDRDHTTILHSCNRVESVVEAIGMPVDDSPVGWARFLHSHDWPSVKALRK